MPLWKSSSSAGRPKTANSKSIRGTISGPIPIPSPLDDDEFPIRNPGTGIATTSPTDNDDEFPIRSPGTGIASPVPPAVLTDPPADEPAEELAQLPAEHELEPEPESEQEQEPEPEPEYEPLQPPPPVDPSTAVGVSESSMHIAPDAPPEPPSEPAPPPPPETTESTESPGPIPRVSPPRASLPRGSPPRASPPRQFALSNSPPKERAVETPLQSPLLRNSPPRATAPAPMRMTNHPSTLRYSTVSETPTGQTNQSRDTKEPPARKKSTLRSTFSKLFGRKKKKSSGSPDNNRASAHISGFPASTQHQSDPTAFSRAKEPEPKRSASLPITEFDRPLRSHSIGPNDIIAIESARNSLQADPGPGRRRAATATTASRLYLRPRRDTEWGGGLSPRPISSHGRGSRVTPGQEDPNEIGRAITSDSGNGNESTTGHRRRSRSLSGLHDYASGRGGVRRRSDEIRYWRESYDPGFMSPLSSNAQEDNDTTGGQDVGPESPAVDRPPKTPPQPFNFGSITKDMVGMKITQAASIDARIGSLEARTTKIERVVDQLCHSVPGFKSPLADSSGRGDSSQIDPGGGQPGFAYTSAAPPMIPAVYQAISSDARDASRYSSSRHSGDTDAHSQVSFGDAPTYIGSLHPPSSSAGQTQSLTSTAPAVASPLYRPTSTSTVRGVASLPTMGRDASEGSAHGAEHYSNLVSQLEAERAARQALEAQVKKLSERVNSLSTTMFAMVGGPAKSRSQERPAPPPTSGSLPKNIITSLYGPKSLSVFETSDDDENDKKSNPQSPRDDESLGEDFQTPREGTYPQQIYGAFGEELREDDVDDDDDDDDDPKRKKAARTLSLSQLTLKKGAQTQIR